MTLQELALLIKVKEENGINCHEIGDTPSAVTLCNKRYICLQGTTHKLIINPKGEKLLNKVNLLLAIFC